MRRGRHHIRVLEGHAVGVGGVWKQQADTQCRELLRSAANGYRDLVVNLTAICLSETGLPQFEPFNSLKELAGEFSWGDFSDNLERKFHAVLNYARANGWFEPRGVR